MVTKKLSLSLRCADKQEFHEPFEVRTGSGSDRVSARQHFGVRRQSEAATALWIGVIYRRRYPKRCRATNGSIRPSVSSAEPMRPHCKVRGANASITEPRPVGSGISSRSYLRIILG